MKELDRTYNNPQGQRHAIYEFSIGLSREIQSFQSSLETIQPPETVTGDTRTWKLGSGLLDGKLTEWTFR